MPSAVLSATTTFDPTSVIAPACVVSTVAAPPVSGTLLTPSCAAKYAFVPSVARVPAGPKIDDGEMLPEKRTVRLLPSGSTRTISPVHPLFGAVCVSANTT